MKKRKYIGISLLVLSFALIGMGIHQNEMGVVLSKAVKICLECVGIG